MNVTTPYAAPEARKQRLLRETLGNADGLMPSAESVGKVFVAIGLALMAAAALSGILPESGERVATLAADANVAPARQSLSSLQGGGASDPAESEGPVQDLTY